MAATLNPAANGQQRRSLANELDRFDSMIDGLDQGIKNVIADAVKESVGAAIGATVRATVLEIIGNPDLLAVLRGGAPASASANAVEQLAAPEAPAVSVLGRARQVMSSAWRRVLNTLKATGRVITWPIRTVVRGVRGATGAYHDLKHVWNLRKPVLIALGAGLAVGVLASACAPWLAGVLSGVGAAGGDSGRTVHRLVAPHLRQFRDPLIHSGIAVHFDFNSVSASSAGQTACQLRRKLACRSARAMQEH